MSMYPEFIDITGGLGLLARFPHLKTFSLCMLHGIIGMYIYLPTLLALVPVATNTIEEARAGVPHHEMVSLLYSGSQTT